MKKFLLALTLVLLALSPARAGFHGHGYGGFSRFGYGGYGAFSYGYAPFVYSPFAYAQLVYPQVTQQVIYAQPVVAPVVAPAVAPVVAPQAYAAPAAAPVAAPVQAVAACPTAAVVAQEVTTGFLTVPTVQYLTALPAYDRFTFLHRHYGGFGEAFHFRHFGRVSAGFRARLGARAAPNRAPRR